ncbi:hypothetical protein K439DRAFT_1543268 [Ramaria rubella]|nr:hypothetical protein K439DRAFT_1543268 [Ramaria rubella]
MFSSIHPCQVRVSWVKGTRSLMKISSLPALDPAMLACLANIFAEAILEGKFSVAALQGYLLKNKSWLEAAAKSSRCLQGRSPRESLIIDERHDNIESMHKTRKKIKELWDKISHQCAVPRLKPCALDSACPPMLYHLASTDVRAMATRGWQQRGMREGNGSQGGGDSSSEPGS